MEMKQEVYRQIVAEAKSHAPIECCGYLAGVGQRITRAYPLKNMDQSSVHFSFDPGEQFATIKKIRKEQLKVLAVYHSHPETPARPSEEDIRLAFDSEISYVIVSLCEAREVVRSFQVHNGQATPEELTIL